MAGEWREHSLGELCSLITDGKHGDCRNEAGSGYYFLSVKDVFGDRMVYDNARQIMEADFAETHRRTNLEPGDVLFTNTGTIGRMAIAPDDPKTARTTFQKSVAILKPKREIVLSRFLYFALRFDNARLSDFAAGTTQKNLLLRDLRAFTVLIPPLAEQKAIAAVLGALDDKIELNRRMNATLEAMARALFQSWFVDFDPVRAKLDGRNPVGLDHATAALFPEHLEDSPLGKKPVGWEVTVLENVLEVLETGGRPKGGVGGITSGIPSIGAESIVSVGVFDFGKTKFVPVEFHEGMRKGHIQSHDVLLYKDGGRPGEYEPHVSMFGDGFPFEKCSINEHVYRIRTNERLSQEYLYFWMTSEFALAEMRIKGTGVAIPGLNSTAVRSLGVLVPPPPIIRAFTKQAAPLVTRILSNAKQSRTLATLRDTLLPKLLSGELNVARAATSVKEAV